MAQEDDKENVGETVQVALRVRPLIESEISRGCETCLDIIPNEPQVQVKGLAFTYNYVFPSEISQAEFYDTCIKSLTKKLHKGYNVTVLAYGQTGSGKTYSIGTSYEENKENFYDAGVIPRAIQDIFTFVLENSHKYEFKISVSFMELYQEQLYDLLSKKPREQSIIDIREDQKGIILPGLTEEIVSNINETMACLIRGSEGRVTGLTAMNIKSSRSHAIFTVHISQENKDDRNQSTTSKFHLVDLAGSERSKKTKTTGNRFKEGVKINQGLLALGNVISALGDGSTKGFVGYRDSKLTRLLQDSLGGNSLTLMIACVSPADYNLEETISTLRYADRARHIRNKPIINQDAKFVEITRLNKIIQELRLQILNEGKGTSVDFINALRELEDEKSKNINLSEKYTEIILKNKNLTNLLQKSLHENTNMVERATITEASKEKFEQNILELIQECDQAIEYLSKNTERNETHNEILKRIYKIKTKLNDIQNEQENCEKTISDVMDNDDDDVQQNHQINELLTDLNENSLNEKEEAYAMEQVAKNDELKNLMKTLSEKKNLADKLMANNKCLSSYNESMRLNEDKIVVLEKERGELIKQLQTVQQKPKTDPSAMEGYKTKISTLENEISDLKKKCAQQANLIKIKEKNDIKIATLNNEIHQMKVAKVRLIKTMRSENERFRAWKLQNEKQIAKLCNKDRKMQTEMIRMENKYTKQQYVLKRKMEEAVAANKKLKEILERQKNMHKQKFANNSTKSEQVVQWLENELELISSLIFAKQTLEALMEDRSILTTQLEELKQNNPNDPDISVLQKDILLHNAQIADLQQRIIEENQEDRLKSKWNALQSMADAKSALKHLFDFATDLKKENIDIKLKEKKQCTDYDSLKTSLVQTSDKMIALQKQMEENERIYERNLLEIEKQNEEKILTLMKQLGSENKSDNKSQVLEILQDAFEQLKSSKDKLEKENELYREKNPMKKKQLKNPVKKRIVEDIMEFEDTDEFDDSLNDPDWRKTPAANRKVSNRSQKYSQSMINTSDEPSTVKRTSDGQTKCCCKTDCAFKLCSCKKLNMKCGNQCRCNEEKCVNRDHKSPTSSNSSENMNNTYSVDDIHHKILKTESETDSDDLFEKYRGLQRGVSSKMLNTEKKKRSFFYHNS